MNARHAGLLLLAAATTATTIGCGDRDLRPLNPCTVTGVVRKISAENISDVDLLFMVDNSGSMAEEQEALREQFPRLVNILVSGYYDYLNVEPDSEPDFPPVRSLRVGVISSDMGVLGVGEIPRTSPLPVENVTIASVVGNSITLSSPPTRITAVRDQLIQGTNMSRVATVAPPPDPMNPVPVTEFTVVDGSLFQPGAASIERWTSGIGTCGASQNQPFNVDRAYFGDDGAIRLDSPQAALLLAERGIVCEASYANFLTFIASDDPSDPDTQADYDSFAEDVSCTASLGTTGCGFEMQLESVLVAMTDHADTSFNFVPNISTGASRDRRGQAGPPGSPGANAGFFRENAVTAVILVTDEEDCSTANTEVLMSPGESLLNDPAHPNRFNTRCMFFADELYPMSRYVNGLIRAVGDPSRLIFAGIIGMPRDLETDDYNTVTYDGILADERMSYRDYNFMDGEMVRTADPFARVFVRPACFVCPLAPALNDMSDHTECPNWRTDDGVDPEDGFQWAAPGRRFVELARELDRRNVGTFLQSICNSDFTPAIEGIIRRIADKLRGACLPRALNPDATGRVSCDVVEILPLGMSCADRVSAGREATPIRVDDDRQVCRITQVVPTAAERAAGDPPAGVVGWFYDNYTTTTQEDCANQPQRIGLTDLAEPEPGSDIRLECLQPVQGGGIAGPDIYQPCSDDVQCAWLDDGAPQPEWAEEFILRYNLERERFFTPLLTTTSAMFCEPVSNTCQISCANDSQCPGGFVCADPDLDDANPATFCINPTCGV